MDRVVQAASEGLEGSRVVDSSRGIRAVEGGVGEGEGEGGDQRRASHHHMAFYL